MFSDGGCLSSVAVALALYFMGPEIESVPTSSDYRCLHFNLHSKKSTWLDKDGKSVVCFTWSAVCFWVIRTQRDTVLF